MLTILKKDSNIAGNAFQIAMNKLASRVKKALNVRYLSTSEGELLKDIRVLSITGSHGNIFGHDIPTYYAGGNQRVTLSGMELVKGLKIRVFLFRSL